MSCRGVRPSYSLLVPKTILSCFAWSSWPALLFYRYDIPSLNLDFLELLQRFIPTEYELNLIRKYEKEQRPLDELSDEDLFMIKFSKIPRLAERMNIMTFLGNFGDTVQLLLPVRGRVGQLGLINLILLTQVNYGVATEETGVAIVHKLIFKGQDVY